MVKSEDGCIAQFKPDELGCYVNYVNKTDRGLAKQRHSLVSFYTSSNI